MNWRIIFTAAFFFLNACSVTPEKPLQDFQLTSRQHLQQLQDWAFEGRLAVVDENDSVSLSIVWRHGQDRDDIELAGPLAQGRTKISVSPGQVTIDDGESRNVYLGEPEQVFAEQLGVDMPVGALKFWVLGVNEPKYSYAEQPGGFSQSGWLVIYREMQKANSEVLPKKITAEKDKAKIKLIIDQWEI
jgi:outer membrane lipoprotein LolB